MSPSTGTSWIRSPRWRALVVMSPTGSSALTASTRSRVIRPSASSSVPTISTGGRYAPLKARRSMRPLR